MKLICWLWLFLLPALPVLAYTPQSTLGAVRSDMASINTALDAFQADCGRYPVTADGWSALLERPTNNQADHWHGPYLDSIPNDPWGNAYIYECPGRHNTNGFDLYSCGPDGISKSHGSDFDDINNWDPSSPHGGSFGLLHPLASIGLAFLGNLGLFVLLACMSFQRETTASKPSLNWRQWAGMLALLWFALVPGLAVYGPVSHSFFVIGENFIIPIWFVVGLILAISGMRSGSALGVFAGALVMCELLYNLVPKMMS